MYIFFKINIKSFSCSLGKDVLLPYLEMKYDEDDHNWCEQIPDEILFKHAVHVFLVSINHAAK